MSRRSIFMLGAGMILALVPFVQGCDGLVGSDLASVDADICSAPSDGAVVEPIENSIDASELTDQMMELDSGLAMDGVEGNDGISGSEEDVPPLVDDAMIDDSEDNPVDVLPDDPATGIYDASSEPSADLRVADLANRDASDSARDTSSTVRRDGAPDSTMGRDSSDTAPDTAAPQLNDTGIEAADVAASPDATPDASSTSLADVGADIAEIDMGPDVPDAHARPLM